jgi:hypothetical protein
MRRDRAALSSTRPTTKIRTPTVFTSHWSTLKPVTDMKLFMSKRGHTPVRAK